MEALIDLVVRKDRAIKAKNYELAFSTARSAADAAHILYKTVQTEPDQMGPCDREDFLAMSKRLAYEARAYELQWHSKRKYTPSDAAPGGLILKGGGSGGSGGGGGGKADDVSQCKATFEATPENNVTWASIEGLEDVKKKIEQQIINPMRYPIPSAKLKKPPQNLLLYGPGGTGKSFITKAIATISGFPLFAADVSQLTSAYVGVSEKCLALLLKNARVEKSIIFLDEVDGLLGGDGNDPHKEAFKATFKAKYQSGEFPVLIAATNKPWEVVDRRFGMVAYAPLPDMQTRIKSFSEKFPDKEHHKPLTTEELAYLGALTGGFSMSEVIDLYSAARSSGPKSFGNVDDIRFVDQGSYWSVHLASDNVGKRLHELSDAEQEGIRWPGVELVDYCRAIRAGLVKPAATLKALDQFVEYAVENNDVNGTHAIQANIADFKAGTEARESMRGCLVQATATAPESSTTDADAAAAAAAAAASAATDAAAADAAAASAAADASAAAAAAAASAEAAAAAAPAVRGSERSALQTAANEARAAADKAATAAANAKARCDAATEERAKYVNIQRIADSMKRGGDPIPPEISRELNKMIEAEGKKDRHCTAAPKADANRRRMEDAAIKAEIAARA